MPGDPYIFKEKFPLGKNDPKIGVFFFRLKHFVIDFCWKLTVIKIDVVQSSTWQAMLWDSLQGFEFPRLILCYYEQVFIQAILISGKQHKKLNLLTAFWNSIFFKF